MAKTDPTKSPEFQRTLHNLLTTPHKTQAELKIGKRTANKKGRAAPIKTPRG